MDMAVSRNGHDAPRADAEPAAPTLPRHIALINADDGTRTATALILDDFDEAFAVYAHHDVSLDAFAPQIDRVMPGSLDTDHERSHVCFDTAVLGCALCDGNSDEHVADLIRVLVKNGSLGKGARLYAIVSTTRYEPDYAIASFTRLEAICSEYRLAWCGGLAVGASDMIPATAEMPRMGMMRRRLSEATDMLILAVRCSADAGTIMVPASVPRFVYRLFNSKL